MNYEEFFTRFYHNGSGYLNYKDEHQDTSKFHIGCSFTKKKKCFCSSVNNPNEDKISKFLLGLYNGEYDINVTGTKIQIHSSKAQGESSMKELIREQINQTNYRQMKEYNKHANESYLNLSDYREIEKSINEDKKICEKCGASLYGDNYHKGWKNENGDYVLLCFMCNKKYFAGANEIKYDVKRDEYPNRQQTYSYTPSYHTPISNTVIPPFKTDNNINHRNINFQVINTAKVDDQSKRKDVSEFVCSIAKCGKNGRKSDFAQCTNCSKYYHPGCIDPSLILKYVNRFEWWCYQCMRCCQCFNNDSDVIKCSTCNRGFHQSCYKMLQVGVKMYCADCILCKNCQKILPSLTIHNQNEMLMMVKGYRVCEECWTYYYKNSHYCPNCLQIYKQQNDQLKIYCNKCLNSYHIECENITPEELNEMKKKKNAFTCSNCKQK